MIFENELIFIEREPSALPWLKIFTRQKYKELSDCPARLRGELFEKMLECERALIDFYRPEKINIASFGNYLPRVHIHLIARFKNDEFFPESVWGKAQREAVDLGLPSFDDFEKFLRSRLG